MMTAVVAAASAASNHPVQIKNSKNIKEIVTKKQISAATPPPPEEVGT